MSALDFHAASNTLVRALSAIDRELTLDRRTSPEDQLKVPVSTFLQAVGELRPGAVRVISEHRQVDGDEVEGVRLDLAVKNGRGQIVGHIELKAQGKSANPFRKSGWTRHDKDQWKRLSNHSNLVYCNGWEWTLLRHGLKTPLAHVVLEPDGAGVLPTWQVEELSALLDAFLSWKPISPSTPKGLAAQLAPLAAYLRESVKEIVAAPHRSALERLYGLWKADLMPGATGAQFADSFAQTFTYALLLARVESDLPAESFAAETSAPVLRAQGHRLIGSVLAVMSQEGTRALVDGPVSLLEATVGSVDVEKFTAGKDPWLYFYEDFLAAYDPKMRKDAGVYYTPVEVVATQVRFLDDIVRTRFGRQDGLGDDDINILDPAAGTGSYGLAVARHVLDRSHAPQDSARSLARRLNNFELLVGPYAVAHLRLTQMLEATGIDLVDEAVKVFLTNTLNDHGSYDSDAPEQVSIYEVLHELTEETRRAGKVKSSNTAIRVILGNPPYDRGSKRKAIGVGSPEHHNIVLQKFHGNPPLLDDFIRPLTERGAGGQAKNLYNSYIYFLRWAIWKACEQRPADTGVVSFITSSSYLRGPGFAGVREHMRRTFDEIWIIDLGGDGRGARKEENVFAIQTPVAIFFAIQHERTSNGAIKKRADREKHAARVHYVRLSGSRKDKLAALTSLQPPKSGSAWREVARDAQDWGTKFVVSTAEKLADGVPLETVFPHYISGAQFKRTWPIASTPQALKKRWGALFDNGGATNELLASDRDLSVDSSKRDPRSGKLLSKLSDAAAASTLIEPARYGYRSFDRQWCIPDPRVATYLRQELWNCASSEQIYLASLSTTALSAGPAVTISPYVPDLHFFRGSYGAKDIFPVYLEPTDEDPQPRNVAPQVLASLENRYGQTISQFELTAYVVGLLGTGAYTEQFLDELAESPACVLFPVAPDLFNQFVALGRNIIYEQTWGERGAQLNEYGQPEGNRFVGKAALKKPGSAAEYPDTWSYNSETRTLHVGDGQFDYVEEAVVGYEVSGMSVLRSWLGYRMKKSASKSSSPLDRIQADTWSHDRELLDLLWQIEFMLDAHARAKPLIMRLVAEKTIPVKELVMRAKSATSDASIRTARTSKPRGKSRATGHQETFEL